ncbi:MAG TPA: aldo/keto reductase [Edaphocola sp.]|nr:aldo/keto reductase [Edaphocola sp.]
MKSRKLSNGVLMPQLGLGVWKSGIGKALNKAMHAAIDCGYRHFDTASFYENEEGVGQAIKESTIHRNDFFITTKVWNEDQGYEQTLKAFDLSLKKLNSGYVDLYLVHWPVTGKYLQTWKALEYLYQQGAVKAIGVSNFLKHHLETLLPQVEIAPMVNQLEHHPYLVQKELQTFCRQNLIQFEAWSPLMQGGVFEIPLLEQLSKKYNKSIAQVVLRWNIQNEIVVIPKSIHSERIKQNFEIWDFEIEPQDMEAIDALDQHIRVGPDPDSFV